MGLSSCWVPGFLTRYFLRFSVRQLLVITSDPSLAMSPSSFFRARSYWSGIHRLRFSAHPPRGDVFGGDILFLAVSCVRVDPFSLPGANSPVFLSESGLSTTTFFSDVFSPFFVVCVVLSAFTVTLPVPAALCLVPFLNSRIAVW